MNRFIRTFQDCQPFNAYITGGDGGIDYCVNCALALIEGGVDTLEIALPFSDPVADGPVIQRSHQRALECGTTGATLLEIARRLRKHTNIPLVLFSYFNPLFQKGEKYLHQLKEAGFDAVLAVDLPAPVQDPDSEPFFKALKAADLLPILLAAPSTENERLTQIGKIPQGFLYYVAQKGTTGVRSKLANDFSAQIARIRQHVQIPVVAGFGIANRESAKAALECADGFVVGSAFVKLMEEKVDPSELKRFAQSLDPR